MSRSELLQQILAYPKFGAGIGLHRMCQLWDHLRTDFPNFKPAYIKVTGSNGKGSTCAMLASLFRALGVKAGCFTSPHLLRFGERITIDQAPISHDALQCAKDWVDKAIRSSALPEPSFGGFERLTAMALYHFALNQVQHGVFEVGIGGRYDPVRTVPGSICALTSLDLEHTQLLGDSLELIAYDKLDLCPPGGSLVLFPMEDPDLRQRLGAYASLRNIRLIDATATIAINQVAEKQHALIVDLTMPGGSLAQVHVSLSGTFQISNLQVALSCFWLYVQQHFPNLDQVTLNNVIRQGLANVRIAGRLGFRPGPPPFHFDIAHTPQAVDAFVASIEPKLRNQRVLLVLGVSHDKPVSQMVASLLPLAHEVVCTQAYQRGAPAAQIMQEVSRRNPQIPRYQAETIEQAVDFAKEHATKHGMTVVVAGGLFLVAEALRYLDGDHPTEVAL